VGELRAAMRMMSMFVVAAPNTHRYSFVWRIAVCRRPAGERRGRHSDNDTSPQLLHALQRSIGQSEAHDEVWRWKEVSSAL
jgi:hypothetical protein